MSSRTDAIAFYNKAVEINEHDKQNSYKLFVSSVEIDPSFHEGWYACGNAASDMDQHAAAVACFRRALETNSGDSKIWTNLGWKLYSVGRLGESRKATAKALQIDQNNALAWCNLSLIQSNEGELKESLKSALKANELQPDYAPIETALAFAYLYSGDYSNGIRWFDARFKHALPQYQNFPYPVWKGEDISDKTLFVVSEQGMGDALSFLRFVPLAATRCQTIIVQVMPELMKIAGAMLRGIPNLQLLPMPYTFPGADYWVASMTLPVSLWLTSEQIATCPNLPVPSTGNGVPPLWKANGRKLHIGICWAGNPLTGTDRFRSMNVEQFLDLYRVPGIQLYSLQIGGRASEMHDRGCSPVIKDMVPFIRDVADTMAIMRDLDLIITVESAVGHVAGAIDKECWVLYSYMGGDWRIGREGKRALWYPKTRIFKQGRDQRWEPVIEAVILALRERLNG